MTLEMNPIRVVSSINFRILMEVQLFVNREKSRDTSPYHREEPVPKRGWEMSSS